MQVAGSVFVRAPSSKVAAALRDPNMIASVVPACRGVQATGPDSYVLRIEYAGPVPIGMDVEMKLEPLRSGAIVVMKAGNVVTGRLSSRTELTLAGEAGGCRISWDGSLAASGLAGRLIAGRDDAVVARANRMFSELGAKIEQAAPAPGAA
ncbi:CoxG family protein [Neotabrizicola shimadae]|uniref:SRPBCC family protein n=1 Tax=Neotabrizicola shimadae TaxID=2807096 RepID=A0A8G1EEB0_9RHOB|nr:SRPBCC domain-containing protein [Neotabrizicola shimadae]QYZ71111.1 SRPBCC family protein [Neotabrizicola shimadae]